MTTTTTELQAINYIPAVNIKWANLCEDGDSAMLYTVDGVSVVFYEANFDDLKAGIPPHNWFILNADMTAHTWLHCQEQVDDYFAEPEPEHVKSWFKWF